MPLNPFIGIIAVAPLSPTVGAPGVSVPGVQSSTPPGVYGGNIPKAIFTGVPARGAPK